MNFNEIIKTVHDVWNFSWPPIVLCVIAYFIARYLNKKGTIKAIYSIYNISIKKGEKIKDYKKFLEPFGLTKVIPIGSFIILIGLLYIINGPITVMVSNLPPHISYNPDVLMQHRISENEKLLILRTYPTAISFNDAYYMALSEFKKDSKNTIYNPAEIYYKIHNFLKFGFLISLILVAINIKHGHSLWKQLFRFINLFLILLCVWLVSFTGLLYQEEQKFTNEWRTIKSSLQNEAKIKLSEPISKEEKDKLEHLNEYKWWRIYFFDNYRLKWIYRTFFEDEIYNNRKKIVYSETN